MDIGIYIKIIKNKLDSNIYLAEIKLPIIISGDKCCMDNNKSMDIGTILILYLELCKQD